MLLFLAGSFAPGPAPAIEAPTPEWGSYLAENRARVLAGAVLTVTAVPLLLAVLADVTQRRMATSPIGGLVALSAWVFAFGFLIISTALTAAVVWRGPEHLDPSTVRFAVDAAHLSLWGLSAGPAAVAVTATTAAAWRQGLAPRWLVTLAIFKVLTCAVEVAGVGATAGWNAGGYASLSSGVALVGWLVGIVWVAARGDVEAVP